MFCAAWGGNQFTPLLLMYRQLGGYSTFTVDMFLGSYVLGLIPGLLIAGPLSDRHGRRRVMVIGTAVSLLASAVLALGVFGSVPLYAGRLLSGIALGIAMSVGTSWLKELSTPPYDTDADAGSGARRATLATTLGFALGAGVAGSLAQWGPWPMVLPYIVHIALVAPVLIATMGCTETHVDELDDDLATLNGEATSGGWDIAGLWAMLRVPTVGHSRFLRVVLPMAPWIFGAAGIAYAVLPQLTAPNVGHWQLAYATLLSVCTLLTGALIQPVAKRLDRAGTARAVVIGMLIIVAGVAAAAVDAQLRLPWLGLAIGMFLGIGYGIAMVSGLLEIQRICAANGANDLAGVTGVYYALSYIGFLFPVTLAGLANLLSYPELIGGLAVAALACTALVTASSRRPLSRRARQRPDEAA